MGQLTLPKIVERTEQPYVAITSQVTMREIGPAAQTLLPEVFGWLQQRGIASASAPFFKYNVIDMARKLEIEFGVPTSGTVAGDGRVHPSLLPAGRYVSVVHRGHYDELYDATSMVIGWAKERGIRWDAEKTEAGEKFGCRLEIYRTDPRVEPDPANWETEIAIKVADAD
jgi:effector-binding domain-containing protein